MSFVNHLSFSTKNVKKVQLYDKLTQECGKGKVLHIYVVDIVSGHVYCEIYHKMPYKLIFNSSPPSSAYMRQ